MARAWRIDSLDPTAGSAFASWRDETLFEGDTLEEAPVFYIGAPSFQAQPVANRGVALAAERHGFQLGLLDDKGEVAFQTLDDVAEFVRRLYLVSTRRDGTPDGGASAVPRPRGGPLGGGELVRPPELPHGPLGGEARQIVELIRTVERGRSLDLSVTWRSGGVVRRRRMEQSRLALGASIVLSELLHRFPMGEGETSPDAEELERWRVAAQTFVAVVHRLGLIETLEEDAGLTPVCARFLSRCWSRVVEPVSLPPSHHQYVRVVLRLMARQSRFAGMNLASEWLGAPFGGATPIDELARLPLPEVLGKAIRAADVETASVATLLSVSLGSPAALAADDDVEAVLLFAASRVVAVDGEPFVVLRTFAEDTSAWDNLTSEHRSDLLYAAARAWLAENLPQRAFHEAVESMIEGSAQDYRYNPGPAGGGEPGHRRRRAAAAEGVAARAAARPRRATQARFHVAEDEEIGEQEEEQPAVQTYRER